MLSGATLLCILALWGVGGAHQQTPKACIIVHQTQRSWQRVPHVRKFRGKGELLYRLAANGDNMRSKNSTRYAK